MDAKRTIKHIFASTDKPIARQKTLNAENAQRGFTMAELLTVVAIIVILLAIAIPGIVDIAKQMRQKELDSKAEIIYVAAQNQLSKLYASGCEQYFQPVDGQAEPTVIKGVPSDATEEDGIANDSICYITSDMLSTQGSAAQRLFDDSTLDEELLNQHWVIEYNFATGTVYSVFFSGPVLFYPDPANCASEYKADFSKYDGQLRSRSLRLADGARVGYHGGAGSAGGSDSYKMTPSVTISNEETLSAAITCSRPVGVTDDLIFRVKVSDTQGNSFERYYTLDGTTSVPGNTGANALEVVSGQLKRTGRSFSLDLTLDSLATDAQRFINQYGSGSGHNSDFYGTNTNEELVAGTDLTVEVFVTCPANQQVSQNVHAKATTNSLFADDSTNTQAVVAYGRHLQNLDSQSGVVSQVAAAVQSADIALGADSPWQEAYGESYFNGLTGGVPNFRPINNASLVGYEGQGTASQPHVIANLTVNGSAGTNSAGLFESLSVTSADGTASREVTLKNIVMTGTSVAAGSSQSAGALVGWVGSFASDGTVSSNAGALTIQNCQVYLTAADISGKTNADIWITGENVGGLVGALGQQASLSIKDSFASTVAGTANTGSAGGLVGAVTSAQATLGIQTSYADSYLVGNAVGGLVGASLAESASVTSSYAAGFLTYADSGAGLIDGVAALENSYTIVESYYAQGTTYYSTASDGPEATNTYYVNSGTDHSGTSGISSSTTSDQLAQALGDAFTTDTANTHPYNLLDQGLTTYTYPRLTAHDHYGDWSATFQEGYLVYFEVYADGTCGFFGANVESTLKSSFRVVGDGYGIVYKQGAAPTNISQVVVTVGGNDTYLPGNSYTVYGSDSNYEVYPLDTTVVNPTAAVDGFYQKVTIKGATTESAEDAYYFNPHFAKTVGYLMDPNAPLPSVAGEDIAVRSARQLNNLSLYYDGYADVTSTCTYLQERSIDYAEYEWNTFGNRASVDAQQPIGMGGQDHEAFRATYNGQCYSITDVSFVTGEGNYVGFVGYNQGAIKNVVLRTDYSTEGGTNYRVQREGRAAENQSVYMGALVGYNAASGSATNCAVAGYYLAGSEGAVHAYANDVYYLGGLVGGNSGSLSSCEATFPVMEVSANYATVRAGGLVGAIDSGLISNCYAIGHIEVVESKGGNVRIAGFAGANSGLVTNSYCATALTASGSATSFGFSPKGGSVSDTCYYLDGGSYTYVGNLNLYKANASTTAGTAVGYASLCNMSDSGYADAAHSYNHRNTVTSTNAFAYRAVVKNAQGSFVHYGDWQDEVNLGSMGVFYWEREEGGSNDGYHFTFLGLSANTDGSGQQLVSNSSLCTAHDDEGVVAEYGYGVYLTAGELDRYTLEWNNLATGLNLEDENTYNVDASADLEKQMASTEEGSERNFKFFALNTQVASEGNYLYMSGTNNVQNGTLTLSYTGDNATTESCVFEISPFFANALSLSNATELGFSGADTQIAGEGETPHDVSVAPGSADNSYEVRSADQLQYINWNSETKTTTEWMNYDDYINNNKSNPTKWGAFAYLGYVKGSSTSDITGTQAKYVWTQTHDVDASMTPEGSDRFTPIGSMCELTSATSGAAQLSTAYFNGTYNGSAYTIKNVEIESKSECVGLFGIAISAKIHDLILYSENDNVIRTSSDSQYSSDTDGSRNWYCMGGIVGMAGLGNTSTGGSATLKNCTVSGYNLVDERNDCGYGGTNIGGLVGLTNVGMSNCAAVCDILINPQYSNSGRNIRVGGLVGNFRGVTLENCYAGGSQACTTANSTNIHFGGLVGGWFTRSNGNLSANGIYGALTAKPTVKNCYTYVDQSGLTGSSVKTICPVVSNCNNENTSNNVTVSNCYYYAPRSVAYKQRTVDNTTAAALNVTYDQLAGEAVLTSGTYAGKNITYALNASTTTGSEKPNKGHDDTLGTWQWVTTYDQAGVAIDGKYSFPGSNVSLDGKNYPFPTVLTQEDLTFGNQVNVHYGEWPVDGPYWIQARASFDVFDQMGEDGWAYQDFTLNANGKELGTLDASNFSYSSSGIVEVDKVTKNDDGTYTVRFRALKAGSTTVTMQSGSYDAAFTLEVKADLQVSVLDTDGRAVSSVLVKENETEEVYLKAVSSAGADYSTDENLSWAMTATEKDQNIELLPSGTVSNLWTIERLDEGDIPVQVRATYTYNGMAYTADNYITVTQPHNLTLNPNYRGATSTTRDMGTATEYTLTSEDEPMREGYVFDGWNTRANGTGTSYTTGSTIALNEKTTLYAQWVPDYTLTLSYGTTATTNPELAYDSYVTSSFSSADLKPYSNANCTVGGWYTADHVKVLNANGTVAADVDGYTSNGKILLTADRTLYAGWSTFTGFTSEVGAWSGSGTAKSTLTTRLSTTQTVLLEPNATYEVIVSCPSRFYLGLLLYTQVDGRIKATYDPGWKASSGSASAGYTILLEATTNAQDVFFAANLREPNSVTIAGSALEATYRAALASMVVEKVS